MARRGGGNRRGGANRARTTAHPNSLWAKDQGAAMFSIWITVIVWLVTGIIEWFLIGDLLDLPLSHVPDIIRQANFKVRLIQLLILMLPEMVLLIFSEIEHIRNMRHAMHNDRYVWWQPMVGFLLAAAILAIATGSFSLTWFSWVSVTQIVSMLFVILGLRLIFGCPRPSGYH